MHFHRRDVSLVFLWLVILCGGGCQTGLPTSPWLSTPVTSIDELAADDQIRLTEEQQRVQVYLDEFQTKFAARQADRLERHNKQAAAKYARLSETGTLDALLKGDIAALRRQISQTPASAATQEVLGQIQALQSGIETIAFCTSPLIFSESTFDARREEQDFVVEPLFVVTVYGCHLGTSVGQVHLRFTASGESLTLTVQPGHWRDDSIQAVLSQQSGRLDGPAQLLVTTADGQQARPLDAQFHATRVWSFIDPVAHQNVLFVDCGHNTTTDYCEAAAIKGPPPILYAAAVGKHFTFCCSSVSGMDQWAVSLKNGWTLMSLYPNSGNLMSSPDGPSVWFSFVADGYTTCNFFNRDGRITGYQELPSSNAQLQGEVHVAWWVDHSCSGIQYAANIAIVGPQGVPYW